MVKDIQISYNNPWQKIHWRSIETAYNNSPFFLFYRDLLEPFYRIKFDLLLELNADLLNVLFNILGSEKNVEFTDHYARQPENLLDKRSLIRQKEKLSSASFPEYHQTFNPKFGFVPDLSIVDLIFNLGPEATDYIQALTSSTFR